MGQQGRLAAGNIDLAQRPTVKNPDGSVSTVRSISIGDNGQEVLIPTVVNGKVVSDQAAIAHYRQTGQHLGKFDTPDHATAFAHGLHEREATRVRAAPMADPIIIVGADGTEYEFPPGFDPKKAAGIVRQRTTTPVSKRGTTATGEAYETEGTDAPPNPLRQALTSAAHPQSAGDFASLLLPQGISTAISAGSAALRGIGNLRRPIGKAVELAGDVGMHPMASSGRMVRAVGRVIKGPDPRYGASTSPIAGSSAPVSSAQNLATANQRFDRIVQEVRDARAATAAPPTVRVPVMQDPVGVVPESGLNMNLAAHREFAAPPSVRPAAPPPVPPVSRNPSFPNARRPEGSWSAWQPSQSLNEQHIAQAIADMRGDVNALVRQRLQTYGSK